MIKKAVRMKLYPGMKEEYARRHQELWPEMREMLKEHGATSYSIFSIQKQFFCLAILKSKMRRSGLRPPIRKSIVNGGISWQM